MTSLLPLILTLVCVPALACTVPEAPPAHMTATLNCASARPRATREPRRLAVPPTPPPADAYAHAYLIPCDNWVSVGGVWAA